MWDEESRRESLERVILICFEVESIPKEGCGFLWNLRLIFLMISELMYYIKALKP